MCVILIKTKHSQKFNKNELLAHFKVNHDGAGVCCINKDKVWVPFKWGAKNINFETIWDKIDYLQSSNDVNTIIVHFRWGNQGGKTIKQAHPHELINGKLYLIHNGTFIKYTKDKKSSDTQQMAKHLTNKFQQLGIESFNDFNPSIIHTINDEFMYKNIDNRVVVAGINNYLIFNTIGAPRYGHWYKDGIWRCGNFGEYALPEIDLNKLDHYAIHK